MPDLESSPRRSELMGVGKLAGQLSRPDRRDLGRRRPHEQPSQKQLRFRAVLKGCRLSRSLSILLPVFNAQSHLEQTVLSLLDVVPELTSDFEVLIIDDGSSDDTADAAQSLVARYPQLRLIQNQRRQGSPATIKTGLAAARGDVVFLREEGTRLDLAHIGSLWRRMGRRHLVHARGAASPATATAPIPARHAAPTSFERAVTRAGQTAVSAPPKVFVPGFKMFLRSIARELPWATNDPEAFLAEATARGYDCEELRIGAQAAGTASSQAAAADGVGGKPKPRRPNYLARILALTAGN